MKKIREMDGPIGLLFFFGPAVFVVIGMILGYFSMDSIIFVIFMIMIGLKYMHTSIIGKYRIMRSVASDIRLKKGSKILDAGCGHGAFMMQFDKQIEKIDEIVGIDIWSTRDQANNSIEATKRIVESSNLAGKVKLKTASILDMPFNSNEFDLIISSLVLHNIKPFEKRKAALVEISRVQKSKGQLVIMDIGYATKKYVHILEDLGYQSINIVNTGYNGWWGTPMVPTFLITASK